MSISSLKLDIAQNRFFTGEKSDLFSRKEAGKARTFHQKIDNYQPTPLYSLDGLADLFQVGKILVKDETQRFGLNAFKMLGSTYAIAQLLCKKYHINIDNFSFEKLKHSLTEKITFTTTTDRKSVV